jgi:methionyl aminopeptidase
VRLIATASQALANALDVARAGAPVGSIGAAVEDTVLARGHSVCRELMGHGIGRRIHESPDVPNYHLVGASPALTDGLVLTIEPIVSAGTGGVRAQRDGWTVSTADGALAAHVEHTLVITRGRPLLLTV